MARRRATVGGANRLQRVGQHPQDTTQDDGVADHREVVMAREKEEHGGIKFGSAFFGWLAGTGMAVLLTALAAAPAPPSASPPAPK